MHVETSFRWNLGDLICVRRHVGPAHEGNSRTMGMHAGEESDGCIVPVKPRTMPSDIGGGDGGGKAAGRGEGELRRMPRTQRRNQHVTEAASPRIGAAWVPHTPKADHVRPETGARCVSSARRDLRGGRGAILVPTATLFASLQCRSFCPSESGSAGGRPRSNDALECGPKRVGRAVPALLSDHVQTTLTPEPQRTWNMIAPTPRA